MSSNYSKPEFLQSTEFPIGFLFLFYSSIIALPKSPRFCWDIRYIPLTDGKGNQEKFVNALKSWESFHDELADTNIDKLPKSLRGTVLHSHLYERAKDFCKHTTFSKMKSKTGVKLICNILHKKTRLTVVNSTFGDFQKLLTAKRGVSENFSKFEFRFAAAVAKLNLMILMRRPNHSCHLYFRLIAALVSIRDFQSFLQLLPNTLRIRLQNLQRI